MSIALFFVILLAVLIKVGKTSIGPALVAVLAGFYLASTQIAIPIREAVGSAVQSLNGVL